VLSGGIKKISIMYIVFFIMFCFTALISWLWVRGIDNMKQNHPEYKGEDFLNWDDNKVHTEEKF
jgi:hypothetical protein